MKISTRARYGTRLLVDLAKHFGGEPVFLKDIARDEDISEKYLSQIIIPIKAAGLVNSFRGAHGGYILARHPSQITLKEVVETLDGKISFVDCVENVNVCTRSEKCVTRKIWSDLGQKVSNLFAAVTLEDLVKMGFDSKDNNDILNI